MESSPGGRPVSRRPTLEVVAQRAGVSRATASRVLRGASNVSPAAREAVLAAAGEIRYTVNRAARSLVTRRSDSVAFLVAETEDRVFSDPYFLHVLRGAHAEVAAAGQQLVFVVASSPAETEQFLQYASGGHVDGVLLISLHGDDSLPRRLEEMDLPTVINGRAPDRHSPLYWVDADNRAGGALATQRLLDAGARRIATITGPLDMSAGRDRLAGYRDALERAGRTPQDALIVPGDFSVAGGVRGVAALLDRDPDIDAVFAASDLTAIGALQELTRRGKRVPQDVAVVGFDDVHEAALATPALTTVRQPIDELGRMMARVLMARVNGAEPERQTTLPVELVLRASA